MSTDDIYAQQLAADGYTPGSDACLDRCWADFQRCLQNTTFPEQCIAQLEACKRACANAAPDGGGGGAL
jgi:hypothetical protein